MRWCINILLILTAFLCIRYFLVRNDRISAYQEDIRYYFDAIRKYHPNPYVRISQDSLNSLEARLLNESRAYRSPYELHLSLLQCNHYFDFHSSVVFKNNYRKETPEKALLAEKILTQLPIAVINDSLFLSGGRLILSIARHPADYYLKTSARMVSYDFECPPESRWSHQTTCIKAMIGYLSHPEQQLITYYDPLRRKTVKKSIPGLLESRQLPRSLPHYSFHYYPEESIALLNYNTSTLNLQEQKQFNDTLSVFFDSIQNLQIRHLFIDVRNNGGGSDLNHQGIFAHLSFQCLSVILEKTSTAEAQKALLKATKENVYQKYGHPGLTEEQYRQELKKIPVSTGPFLQRDTLSQSAYKGQYTANVYVLQSHRTASAGSSFCLFMRLWGTHTLLVGEPYADLNPSSGNVLLLKLPNSGISFRLPTHSIRFIHQLREEEGRLQPDLPFTFQHADSVTLGEMKKIIRLSPLEK